VGAWAILEAIALPVVPDVGLLPLVLAAPRRWPVLFGALIVGSLLGTVVLWLLFAADPSATQGLVMAVPGIHPDMLSQATVAFAAGDPQPFALFGPGTPLKVLSLAWLQVGGLPVALALWVVVNRLTRIGPVLVVAVVVGTLAPDWLRRHGRLVLVAYAAIGIAVYAWYLA
jgi:hypothetical protein